MQTPCSLPGGLMTIHHRVSSAHSIRICLRSSLQGIQLLTESIQYLSGAFIMCQLCAFRHLLGIFTSFALMCKHAIT